MPLSITCPNCGEVLTAPDSAADKNCRCPQCRITFFVKGPSIPKAPTRSDAGLNASDSVFELSPANKPATNSPSVTPLPNGSNIPPRTSNTAKPPAANRELPVADNVDAVDAQFDQNDQTDQNDLHQRRGKPQPSRGKPQNASIPLTYARPNHRGGTINTFGIISIVTSTVSVLLLIATPLWSQICGLNVIAGPIMIIGVMAGIGFGVSGWRMGSHDIRKMYAGEMPTHGFPSIRSGYWSSAVGTMIAVFAACLLLVLFIFSILILGSIGWNFYELGTPGRGQTKSIEQPAADNPAIDGLIGDPIEDDPFEDGSFEDDPFFDGSDELSTEQ